MSTRCSASGWLASVKLPASVSRSNSLMKANLIGTPEMVAERLRVYRDAGISTLRLGLAGASSEEKLDTLGLTMDLVRGLENSD